VPRAKSYHRSLERSPWLDLLRHLCGLGWSDERMATAMTLLPADAIRGLQTSGWDRESLDDALDDALAQVRIDHQPWTVDQVRYYRRVYLRRKRQRPPVSDLVEGTRIKSRLYQTRQGWGHLLPRDDDGHWLPGHELPPRAVQVLQLLREQSPLSHTAIARGLGLDHARQLLVNGRYVLLWLVRLGLLATVPLRRPPWQLFSLSSSVQTTEQDN
jgi:hypothetical protein